MSMFSLTIMTLYLIILGMFCPNQESFLSFWAEMSFHTFIQYSTKESKLTTPTISFLVS